MTKLRTKGRRIDGILLLDKPKGITSNAALQRVKNLYTARKAGHTGSLDPLASGMLPICLGEATKFSQFLLEADKHYHVVAKLGVKTTTGDGEGEIIAQRAVPSITPEMLTELFAKFTGAISQVPSMFSAIKQNGQPLYKLARQGIEVAREARVIHIHALNYIALDQDLLTFNVHCSKGAYVRTLVEDMGEALGCGAHVQELCRVGVGSYEGQQMVSLSELEALAQQGNNAVLDAYLLPIDSAIQAWPELEISEAAVYYLKRGQPVILPYAPTSGWIRLRRKNGSFLGVGEIMDDGRVAPERLVQE